MSADDSVIGDRGAAAGPTCAPHAFRDVAGLARDVPALASCCARRESGSCSGSSSSIAHVGPSAAARQLWQVAGSGRRSSRR
eukprot:2673426-Alexandrium_andersonii.AAC.1